VAVRRLAREQLDQGARLAVRRCLVGGAVGTHEDQVDVAAVVQFLSAQFAQADDREVALRPEAGRRAGDDRFRQAGELQRDLLDVEVLDQVLPGDRQQVLVEGEAQGTLAIVASACREVSRTRRRDVERPPQRGQQGGATHQQVGHVLAGAEEQREPVSRHLARGTIGQRSQPRGVDQGALRVRRGEGAFEQIVGGQVGPFGREDLVQRLRGRPGVGEARGCETIPKPARVQVL
jgi:hypothetical protein